MFQPTSKDKKAVDQADSAVASLKTAKNELKSAKDTAVDSMSDRAEATVHNLRDQAREVGEKVQHFLHDRKDELSHAKDNAERTIRSNPLAATAGAFVIGAIISRLFKR